MPSEEYNTEEQLEKNTNEKGAGLGALLGINMLVELTIKAANLWIGYIRSKENGTMPWELFTKMTNHYTTGLTFCQMQLQTVV